MRLFQVEFLLRLLKQVAARHLRQRDFLLHGATIEFILNQILESLVTQAAIGAVARQVILKSRAGRGEIQSQPL